MKINKIHLTILLIIILINLNTSPIKIKKKIIKGPTVTIDSNLKDKNINKIDNIIIHFELAYAKEMNDLLKAQKALLEKMKQDNIEIPEIPEMKSGYIHKFSEKFKNELNKYNLKSYNLVPSNAEYDEQFIEEEVVLKKMKEYNTNLVLTIKQLQSNSVSTGFGNSYKVEKKFPFEISLKSRSNDTYNEIWNSTVLYECTERQEGGSYLTNELNDEELDLLAEKIINKLLGDLNI